MLEIGTIVRVARGDSTGEVHAILRIRKSDDPLQKPLYLVGKHWIGEDHLQVLTDDEKKATYTTHGFWNDYWLARNAETAESQAQDEALRIATHQHVYQIATLPDGCLLRMCSCGVTAWLHTDGFTWEWWKVDEQK